MAQSSCKKILKLAGEITAIVLAPRINIAKSMGPIGDIKENCGTQILRHMDDGVDSNQFSDGAQPVIITSFATTLEEDEER